MGKYTSTGITNKKAKGNEASRHAQVGVGLMRVAHSVSIRLVKRGVAHIPSRTCADCKGNKIFNI